ncbi:MAG: hypothetical protein ACJ8AG_23250 [Ktedonobacteraceae bacterium]
MGDLMRKDDPIKRQYAILAVCLGLLLLLLIYLTIQSALTGKGGFPTPFAIGFLLFYLLGGIFSVNALRRVHKRTEERRQRAPAGDPSLLANPQPIPDERALSLPTTLTMRLNMKFFFAIIGFMFLIVIITFLVGFFIVMNSHLVLRNGIGRHVISSQELLIPLGIALVILIVFFLLLIFFYKFLFERVFKQEITIDEQGLTTKYYGRTTSLRWSEARCFDIWGGKTQRMIPMELLGENNVVRWQFPNRYRFFYPFTPTLPYEAYRKKVDVMQQVIMAKTGLPLYDLRDKKMIWW